MRANDLWLLLGLKLRLVRRAFGRRRGPASIVAFFLIGIVFAPLWLGVATAAYAAAVHLGAPAVGATIGFVHVAWVAGAIMLGSFAEGFDMAALLRYPIRPRSAFWLNVLFAPFDLVAFFVLPPLVAVAVGSGVHGGLWAGARVSLAIVVLLLTTSAVAQALLALLGRYLRREWSRALFGVIVALGFATPTILAGPRAHGGGGLRALVASSASSMTLAADVFEWFPSSGLPVRAAMAAAEGQVATYAIFFAASIAALVAFAEIGTMLSLRDAMNRTVASEKPAKSGVSSRFGSWAGVILPQDLAVLVGRELRYFLRTPQILIGLPLSPLLVLMLPGGNVIGLEIRPFMLAFVALVAALNLSANQFGIDQAGVRMLLLLPVAPRRILLAKNLSCAAIVATTATLCIAVGQLTGSPLDFLGVLTVLATVLAALPVILSLGNVLSVYHPWRMTFRLGGAPPGAMLSAFAQLGGVMSVGFLLGFPMVVMPVLLGPRVDVRMMSVAVTLAIAAFLWLLWRLVLGFAARAFYARRDVMIDRLVRPTEAG